MPPTGTDESDPATSLFYIADDRTRMHERVVRLVGEDEKEEFAPINRVMYAIDGTPHVINDLSAGRFDIRVTIGRGKACACANWSM